MILEPKVARWAVPLIPPRRYKGAKGGRSGGKSHQLIEMATAKMAANRDFKIVGIREVQKSLRFSVKSLMEGKIREMGVGHLFDIQERIIKRVGGSGIAIFEGMQDHTADSIKGLESFDLALIDEANQLSARSLGLLTPTLRKDGSEIWAAWNPENEDDAIDVFFAQNEGHPDFACVHVNVTDNPFISETGWKEYLRAKATAERLSDNDPNAMDQFRHVWLGDYSTRSDKFVFRNWRVGTIAPPENVVWFYGADWGFANDETAGIRCCIVGNTLYIDAEVFELGVPTEALPKLLDGLPDARKWPMRGDSARPETIDYIKRHGFPKLRSARKGKGSVEDGVSFLQGMEIVISPACPNTAREFKGCSYKVDKRTGEILPVIEDKDNHLIDALRYAVEGLHRKGKLIVAEEAIAVGKRSDYGEDDEDEANWKVA